MRRALILLLLLFSLPGWAVPLKVLVIGGPGGSYVTQKDAMLAEMLGRAYGWDTRFACFYTPMDEAPVWRSSVPREAMQKRQFLDILTLLRDWHPDVTLARIPRKDFNAITPEIQIALVERVKAGMGLVVWSTEHGGVDYTGEPLLEVLAGSGFGGDYTGGVLSPDWKWVPHRLTFGLPMDQSVSQGFFNIPGKAADYRATDLVLAGNDDTGRIRVREAGKGRVVMLGHNTTTGLGPQYYPQSKEPFTMDIMNDHPDWGEIHLRLLQRTVLWAKGEEPGQRFAVNIPPLPTQPTPGAALDVPFQVLNETGQPFTGTASVMINGTPQKDTPITVAAGVCDQQLKVTLPNNAQGWVKLEISLHGAGGTSASPPAVALRYLKVQLPLRITLTADRLGAPRGEAITLTASMQKAGEPGAGPLRVMWTINDYQRRVIFAQEAPLSLSPAGAGSATLKWTVPRLDPTHYRYIARATVMRGTTVLGDATLALYRAERFRLDEGIYHGVWTNIESYPEALHPNILDLYEDAGYRGLHTGGGQVQRWEQEDRNWRGYTEIFGGINMAEWAMLSEDEALMKARTEIQTMLRRQPLADTGAFPILSLGEEAALYARGAPICDIAEQDVPKAEYDKIRQGYLAYLKRNYTTLDKLNAQWGTTYTAWEQAEMPWKYFNFYYPNKAMPDKGVTNMGQAVDQWGYMHDIWQRALDAHTTALQEMNPTVRTLESTGDFYGAAHDTPNATDTGHDFRLDWAFFDDINRTQTQFGQYMINGVTMGAYWFDFPLTFNPDLTHTRASMYRRGEFTRLLERAPVILHAQGVPSTAEVAVMRPKGPYSREFHTLLGNVLPQYFIPHVPDDTWRQLLHISGVFAGPERTASTRLMILPLAVQLSEAQGKELAEFVKNGGTLVTSAGTAGYDLHGKPYDIYPGAGLADLLGITMKADYSRTQRVKWTLDTWPNGKTPETGTLFSTGRDTIVTQAPDVQVLGKYADGTPALLYRKIERGQVLHFNGIYYIPYLRDYSSMPYWPGMGRLAKALLELAGVSPAVNVLDAQGEPLESLEWNLAGAGPTAPGAGDVRYVRILGSLTPAPVRVVTTLPVVFARDVLTGRAAPVVKEGNRRVISFTRGPEAVHYLALFPYQPAKMTIVPVTAKAPAGQMLDVRIRILDSAGKPASGCHAVTLRMKAGGQTVSQWKNIRGDGVINLPLACRDAGRQTIEAVDWTGGLRATTSVTITPSPLATHLPEPLPPVKHGMPPRALSAEETVNAFNRLAAVYGTDPKTFVCADEAKWRLSYYTFMTAESRHELSQHLLAPVAWDPPVLRAAVEHGARWILTGEDLGIDLLQGQPLSPFDHLRELADALRGASWHTVAGEPEQAVAMMPGGGRVLLDRRSFDYWSSEQSVSQVTDWDKTAVVTRSGIGSFSGGAQQFTDAFNTWREQLLSKGLLGETPDQRALLPAPKDFDLRTWWQTGYPAQTRQEILKAVAALKLPSSRYEPPAALAGYRVGALLFSDDFTVKDDRWTFLGGKWAWQTNRLAQVTSLRDLEEGSGWGGTAVIKDIANPADTPILIAADSRITFGYAYGKLGVIGGYNPGQNNSGMMCGVFGTSVMVGMPATKPLATKLVSELLNSPEDTIQFLLLLDGKTLRAKVWNRGSQAEPADWQFTSEVPDAKLGTALALETEIVGYWNNVRVWKLEK